MAEAAGIRIITPQGPIYVISMYIPPNTKFTLVHFRQILDSIPETAQVIVMEWV